MRLVALSGSAILSAVLLLLLRELRSSMAALLRVAAVLTLFGAAVALLAPLLARISELLSFAGREEITAVLLRAAGIALIAEITAAICRDLGENSLAAGVALFAKLELLLLALPMTEELISLARELAEW